MHEPTELGTGEVVGRAVERATLAAVVADLAGPGRGRLVLVQGEAGIGKTTLVSELALAAAAADVSVTRGRADELTAARPFGLAADLVGGLSEATGGPDRDGRAGPGGLVHELAEDVASSLVGRTSEAPLLIIVEDLHLCDDESLLVLHRLASVAVRAPLSLVVTLRPHPVRDVLKRFVWTIEDLGASSVALGPFDEEDTDALVAAVAGAPPGPRLRRLVDRAGGNPLFIRTLAGWLVETGECTVVDDRAEVPEGLEPPPFEATVARHLRSLSPATVDALRDAAVLGTSFRLDRLATVRDEDAASALEAVGPAVTAGLIVDDERGRFAFRHALVRDAVLAGIPSAVRDTLHLRTGRRLAAANAPADVVAHHLGLGAAPGDQDAAEWLARAAVEAAPRAPGLAASQLARALELWTGDGSVRSELRLRRARCLLWSGDLDGATRLAEEVLAVGATPAEEAEGRYVLGRALAYQGRLSEGLEVVEVALQRDLATGPLRGQLLADVALRRGLAGRLADAEDAAARALAAGLELGDPLTVGTARCAMAWNAALGGRPDDAVDVAARALRSAQGADAVEPVQARLYLGIARLHAGDVVGARASLQDVLDRTRTLGTDWASGPATSVLTLAVWLGGEPGRAVELAARTERLVAAGSGRPMLAIAAAAGALGALATEASDEAARLLDVGRREVALAGAPHPADGMLAVARGAVEAARDGQVADPDGLAAAVDTERRYGAWGNIALHLATASRATLDAVPGADLESWIGDLPDGGAFATTACARVRSTGVNGSAVAVDLLPLASTLDGGGAVLPALRLREDVALALAADGDRDRAAALGGDVLAALQQAGAHRDADHLRAALRDRGVRVGRSGPRGRPSSGWASLTPAELRVARLVAEGLSNPQVAERLFISRRTVESHVSSALTKLDVASRVELALAVQRNDDGSP